MIATHSAATADVSLPGCVIVCCCLAIGLGTVWGAWRIFKTRGQKTTMLKPVGQFSAGTGGTMTLFRCTALGIDVSSAHIITGSMVGVAANTVCAWG